MLGGKFVSLLFTKDNFESKFEVDWGKIMGWAYALFFSSKNVISS